MLEKLSVAKRHSVSRTLAFLIHLNSCSVAILFSSDLATPYRKILGTLTNLPYNLRVAYNSTNFNHTKGIALAISFLFLYE